MNVFRNAVFVVLVCVAWTPDARAEDEPAPAPERVGADQAGPAQAAPATDAKALASQLAAKEAPERLQAAEQAKAVQDARLITPLVKLLRDDLYDVRKAAREALVARESAADKKQAAQGLSRELERLAKDPQASGELIQTIDALHDLRQAVAIDPLLDMLKHDTDGSVVSAALLAVANVPDKQAIEELIAFAAARGRRNGEHRRAATTALRYATGENLGHDPDAWRAWWKEHEKTFDHQAAAARRAEEEERARKKAERRREREDGGDDDGGGRRRRPPGGR